MDKAAIYSELVRRNALRKANGLPLLNLTTEYAHAVAGAAQRGFRALCDRHADEREAIRLEVLAELREKHGPDFGMGFGARWILGRQTHQRFAAYIAEKYRLHPEGGGEMRSSTARRRRRTVDRWASVIVVKDSQSRCRAAG